MMKMILEWEASVDKSINHSGVDEFNSDGQQHMKNASSEAKDWTQALTRSLRRFGLMLAWPAALVPLWRPSVMLGMKPWPKGSEKPLIICRMRSWWTWNGSLKNRENKRVKNNMLRSCASQLAGRDPFVGYSDGSWQQGSAAQTSMFRLWTSLTIWLSQEEISLTFPIHIRPINLFMWMIYKVSKKQMRQPTFSLRNMERMSDMLSFSETMNKLHKPTSTTRATCTSLKD